VQRKFARFFIDDLKEKFVGNKKSSTFAPENLSSLFEI
jgi:hypothetical protein